MLSGSGIEMTVDFELKTTYKQWKQQFALWQVIEDDGCQ